MSHEPPESDSSRPPWLSAGDQAAIASLLLIALAMLVSSWWYRGHLRGRYIDIEAATAQPQVEEPPDEELRIGDEPSPSLSSPSLSSPPSPAVAARYQIDINQADLAEWIVLPRVGESLAREILATRQRLGGFGGHEDLLLVPGLGPKTLVRIQPYLLPLDADDASAVAARTPER